MKQRDTFIRRLQDKQGYLYAIDRHNYKTTIWTVVDRKFPSQ